MSMMRAKMRVTEVAVNEYGEKLTMNPVCKSTPYPDDGSDEDNTYAKFSPSGALTLQIQNPALYGMFKPGQKFYLDFTLAE